MQEEDSSDQIRRALAAQPRAASVGRSRTTLVTLVAVALVLIALFGVGVVPRLHSSRAIADVAADNRLTVITVPAARGKASTELLLPGTMLPYQEAPIYARTNGYVKRWLVDIGAHVKAGQLLAEIETPEVDRELKQAIASMGQAKANLTLARSTAERWQGLLKDKAVSQQEIDEKVGALEARKADLAAAEANVQRLQELQQFQHVVAPFEGTITARNVDVGQLITAGSNNPNTWLYKVSKTGTLRLYVYVPQSHTRLIQSGMPADVVLREYPGKVFPGKVQRTAGALDAQSKTLLTEVQVPNDNGELLAGMYAQVRFKLAQSEPTIILPSNTLIMRPDGPQVAAVENNIVKMRKIVLGRDFGQQVEVISGLADNEQVVTNPSDAVREGAAVKIAQAAPDKK
jgi:RND family efflux transporter MFP subunit